MKGAWVQSLDGELRSHMLWGVAVPCPQETKTNKNPLKMFDQGRPCFLRSSITQVWHSDFRWGTVGSADPITSWRDVSYFSDLRFTSRRQSLESCLFCVCFCNKHKDPAHLLFYSLNQETSNPWQTVLLILSSYNLVTLFYFWMGVTFFLWQRILFCPFMSVSYF